MAAGLGYIEVATGDVLTASIANGYLASQVVMVFASAAARTSAIASPQEGMISYLKDTNAVEYYSGSAWAAVGGGGGGGGKVLQVVQATISTDTTVASTSYTDTGITVNITPTLATSKVMIIATQLITMGTGGNSDAGLSLNIMRGGTQVYEITQNQALTLYSNMTFTVPVSMNYLDSPATTSATTYKIQAKLNATSGRSARFQQNSSTSNILLLEIGA